ncbi:YlbG family protein [Fervidibacillus halotolerans]|uniref:UPF0298 protein OE105_06295 n=1 Tax=Fervidibacillus halotolerans TaxID=2980027 RepID=A0A9E8M1B3_9BACI|nr:DUF2129 domain-containing protein [Fervidibacillus halotolerans]WAA13708.1 DUF2129 domain-containing protein [Fervidibacillus halotolerans]
MFVQRQGIIVWLYSLKHVRHLKKYGNIHYVSKRLKYVVLYCNLSDSERIMEKLQSLSFVKKVELSYRPYLDLEFDGKKKDEEKEFDYKLGL